MAKTNLIEVDDYPEPPEGAKPRSFGPSSLWVENVDMLMAVNTMEHQTSRYNIKKLVVRRGQPFRMLVSFSQDVNSKDVHLEFLIGQCERTISRRLKVLAFLSFLFLPKYSYLSLRKTTKT